MSEDTIRRIFSHNLIYFLQLNGKSQKDLVEYIGVSSSTVSNWCTGQKLPRMDKIQSICNWLGVEKSDLLEDKKEKKEQGYYLNVETKERLETLQVNPRLRILFDATAKLDPSDIDYVLNLVERLQKEGKVNM